MVATGRLALPIVGLAILAAACSGTPTGPTPQPSSPAALEPGRQDALPGQAGPSILLKVPGESPGPPFYAISGNGGFIPRDAEWAALPFLRQMACVPAAANLLTVDVPGAFGCSLTVEGHEHWQNGPGLDPAPRQTQFMGLGAVPIVFARWNEVQGATSGVLTLPELLALPSAMVGTADDYQETNVLGVSGPLGAGRGSYKITARGTLPDSRAFRLHVNEVLGELRVVEIEFGE